MRYYWCVNCGHNGDFGRERKRVLVCQGGEISAKGLPIICDSDLLTEITEEEYKEKTEVIDEKVVD